ncbi:MAG: hypothetical protein LBI39_04400 [Puniceicoccales bacterium]|jgi:hypothetical protein|nr:hypothetical protein [Puniceicoccales bacterium]
MAAKNRFIGNPSVSGRDRLHHYLWMQQKKIKWVLLPKEANSRNGAKNFAAGAW